MWVEAHKESHVMEAIRGLRNILVSKGAALVPLGEMVDCITVNMKAKAEIGAHNPKPQTLEQSENMLLLLGPAFRPESYLSLEPRNLVQI